MGLTYINYYIIINTIKEGGNMNDRIKEKWLRDEIRDTRNMVIGLQRWGVTVLVAVETSLYYVRRDIAQNLIS